MRFHLPAAAALAALFCCATPLASAADQAGDARPALTDASHNTVPEPEVPFQIVAFAGALLIWRNRRRTSQG